MCGCYIIPHTFIFEINHFGFSHTLRKVGPEDYLEACEELIESANMQKPVWLNVADVEDYKHDLEVAVNNACEIVTDASFHLLFSDRSFLFEFSQMVGRYVALLNVSEHPCVVLNGEIRRESYFPVWLKNAIFHRDKGRCQLCFKDLTNLLVPTAERHIDHMVPLKAHGTNDPTNLQLTCETCNTSKGANVISKAHLTYPFW